MPGGTDAELALARVYSTAILDLAERQGDAEVVLRELSTLVARLEASPEFETFLASPLVDASARERALEKIFRGKVSDLLVDSLQVLNRKGRLGLLRRLAEAYHSGLQERRGIVEVRVQTAVGLSDAARNGLRDVVARQTGREPELVEEVDPSLLGGMVVRIGDTKLDTSVASRLRKMTERLADRASREIHSGRVVLAELSA